MKFDFLKKDLPSKILALCLSILLWLFVAVKLDVDNYSIVREVPVTMINLSSEYMAMNDQDFYVTVKLTGRKSDLQSITDSDIVARADMNNRGEGNNQVPIMVTIPESAQLASVQPSTLNIQLDAVISSNFKINVVLEGNVADGYELSQNIKAVPSDVLITGPRTLINSIEKVEAYVNVENASDSFKSTVPIQIYDHNNNLINSTKLTYKPELCEVSLNLGEVVSVPIEVNITGTPREDYVLGTVTLNPQTVELIRTDPNAEISSVKTFAIDITDEDADLEKMIGLDIPAGFELKNRDQQYIDIRIDLDRLITERSVIRKDQINLAGKRTQYAYSIEEDEISVELKAIQAVLDESDILDFEPSVDVTEIDEPGTYTLPLSLNLPEDVTVNGTLPVVRVHVTE